MKEQTAIEEFLKEIQVVCLKHNLFLRGVCKNEGQYGEILIQDPEGMSTCGWLNDNHNSLTPKGDLEQDDFGAWYVDGIKCDEIIPLVKKEDLVIKIDGALDEITVFRGSAKGMRALADSAIDYIVHDSYMDANGCMKTYGKDASGRDQESFIVDTKYV